MSNHAGSHMLRVTLELLKEYSVFDALGKEKTQDLVIEIVKFSQKEYDCNACEILEDIDQELGICCDCLKPADEFQEGVCKVCHQRFLEEYPPS